MRGAYAISYACELVKGKQPTCYCGMRPLTDGLGRLGAKYLAEGGLRYVQGKRVW